MDGKKSNDEYRNHTIKEYLDLMQVENNIKYPFTNQFVFQKIEHTVNSMALSILSNGYI